MSYRELFINTDPLALIALGGFVILIVVTVAIFAFLLAPKGRKKRPHP